ncbi:MAG: CvpA family protein [Christensenellales bacterium]
MAVIDIVILCVLVLFGIIGIWKGFLNTIISLFGNLASLAVAILCAKPVSSFLDKIFNIVGGIGGKIAESLAPTIKPFESGITELTGSGLKTYLANDGLTFQERLFNLFIEDSATFTTDAEVVQYIGERIAGVAALVIAVVVMFIVIRIAILLLAKLFNALTKNKAISGLDRAMGLIFGLLKGAILVSLVLGVFYLIANTTVTEWIQNSTITKWVYQYVCEFIDWAVTNFNLPEVITNLFPALQG